MSSLRAISLPGVALIAGCAALDTSDIRAAMTVWADEDPGVTSIHVTLYSGGERIELPKEDTLTANTELDDAIALSGTFVVWYHGGWTYGATLTATDRREFTVAFERSSFADDAPASTVSLPPLVEIDPASLSASLSAAELELRWSNPVEGAQVAALLSTCGNDGVWLPGQAEASDGGALSFPMQTVVEGFDISEISQRDCLGISFERSRFGTPDPELNAASTISAVHSQYFEIALTP